jgi:hypothetical protein
MMKLMVALVSLAAILSLAAPATVSAHDNSCYYGYRSYGGQVGYSSGYYGGHAYDSYRPVYRYPTYWHNHYYAGRYVRCHYYSGVHHYPRYYSRPRTSVHIGFSIFR